MSDRPEDKDQKTYMERLRDDLGFEDGEELTFSGGALPKMQTLQPEPETKDETPIPEPDPKCPHFTPLGFSGDRVFMTTAACQQVVSFKVQQLSSKPVLLMLAPLWWWEREFVTEKGFSGKAVDYAVNFIIRKCQAKGAFRPEAVRGRGAWVDRDRLVVHAGDHLIVDGNPCDIANFRSTFVYEAAPSVRVDMENPLTYEEAHKFYQFCMGLNWERPIYGSLLAGWTTVAIVCGALRWRPHVWLTGQSGCGKSWVLQRIQGLLGEFCLSAKGESTEAGLRQALGADALPVNFDEAEGDSERTAQNMDRILGLIRQSSADIDGRILKGSTDGAAVGFNIRSSFLLSAIRVPLKQRADESRITVLSLRRNGAAERQHFEDFLIPLSDYITDPEYTHRFRARIFTYLKPLLANIQTFSSAAGAHFGTQRIGDQIGPLLAGAYLLHNNGQIASDAALEWIRNRDWTDQHQINEDSDEEKVLAAILEAKIHVTGHEFREDMAVGEVIEVAAGRSAPTNLDEFTAQKVLMRIGLKVEFGSLFVSNTNTELERLLRNTPWRSGWGRILRRIDGAEGTTQMRFGSSKSRAVKIPLVDVLGME